MVSVQQQQSQYITDFNSPISSMDKSPLAMLEKTCETIGLPDTPAKKTSPKSKDNSPSSNENKKNETIITKSPRINPIPTIDKKNVNGCEPSTSMAAGMFSNPMLQRCFPYPPPPPIMNGNPMGFSGMMNPFMMPSFMPPTSMPPMMMPSHMINGRPCVTPGCQTCAQYAMAQFMPNPDVMQQLSFLTTFSNPQSNPLNMSMSSSGKHVCNYNGANGPCGKTFNSEAEHLTHLKTHVAETEQQKSGNTSRNPTPPTNDKKISSPKTSTTGRFHPYIKESTQSGNNNSNNSQMNQATANQNAAMAAQMQLLMQMGMMPPMPVNPLTSGPSGMPFPMSSAPPFNPAAFQAMLAAQTQQQRGTLH